MFAEADEALGQADVFFDAVRQGDALGIEFLAIALKSRAEATRAWFAPWLQYGATFSAAWEFWSGKISSLAKQQDARVAPIAQHILDIIGVCQENQLLSMQLKEVLFMFERPCRFLRTKSVVGPYLDRLVTTGYIERSRISPRWRAINWENAYYYPKRNLQVSMLGWPSVIRAISRVRNQSRKEEELLSRLEPLLEQGTLPTDLQERGLTRLLQGEVVGTIVISDYASRFGGQDTGFLAVLLGRFVPDPSMPIVLMGVIADTPLPEAITTAAEGDDCYEIPPIFLEPKGDGGLRATFGRLSRMDRETHQAMMRIEHLIQWRVTQENRPRQPALLPPASTNP
ncbi:MAG: hypothetical protein Q7S62_01395 [bacterium]|nr:hypothetical protein [bacterium]